MKHIRTKLALSLFAATLLLTIPSYYLVANLLQSSFSIKFNDEVEQAIEQASQITKSLHTVYKNEIFELAENLMASNEIKNLILGNTDQLKKLRNRLKKKELIKITVYDSQFHKISSFQDSSDYLYPALSIPELESLQHITEPHVIGVRTDPNNIFIAAPIRDGQNRYGFITIVKVLDQNFSRGAQRIVEVNQMFKTINAVGENPQRPYLILFTIVYGLIASLSIAVGYFFSRRITSPLLDLSRATQIVANGNWDYRMEVSSEDEIGQLVQAFNQMVTTIKDKQRIALEQERERRRIEKENERRAKDLEMTELRARALQAENERKTLELEKAQELEKAYQALEESHRHLKETQAKLVQTAKMASLGNLAAGVAHEINNPIGAINSAADVTKRAVKIISKTLADIDNHNGMLDDQKFKFALKALKDNTELTVTASNRVVKIVRSLKTFARLDEANYQSVDIHEGIDSTLMLLQHELKNRITIEKEYDDLPPIPCYPDELNQVFMNILSNSAQAIKGRGTIRIKTELKNEIVKIIFEDSGGGHQSRIP